MQICPECNAIKRHVVFSILRRHQVRRFQSSLGLFSCKDTAMLVAVKDHTPELAVPPRSQIGRTRPSAGFAYVKCPPLHFRRLHRIRSQPSAEPLTVARCQHDFVRPPPYPKISIHQVRIVRRAVAHDEVRRSFLPTFASNIYVVLDADSSSIPRPPCPNGRERREVVEIVDIDPREVLDLIDFALVVAPDDFNSLRHAPNSLDLPVGQAAVQPDQTPFSKYRRNSSTRRSVSSPERYGTFIVRAQ